MQLRIRIVAGAVGAPLVAAAPFLALLPVTNLRLLLAAYAAAFVLGLAALIVLDAAGWLELHAFVAAGAAVSLVILMLLPMLQALVAGRWQPPQLFPDAATLFVMLLVLSGAAAGGFWWWMVEPYLWPSTDEMIARLDD